MSDEDVDDDSLQDPCLVDLIAEAIRDDDLEEISLGRVRCGVGTPIHWATSHGASLEVVMLLSENLPSRDFDHYYEEGVCCETPFHVAGKHAGLDVIRYLDETFPDAMDKLNIWGYSCIHTAVESGLPLNVIKYFYNRLRPHGLYHEWYGTNPLHRVGRRTPPDVVQFLADARERFAEDKDKRGRRGFDDRWRPPLHAVLRNGAGLKAVRIVHEAFPRGIARLNKDDGRLPLHDAASHSAPDVVRFLLDRYRDAARTADKASDLPLHLAAGRRPVSSRVVRLLVQAWPQAIHEKNSEGRTPLKVARARGVRDEAVLDVLAHGLPK